MAEKTEGQKEASKETQKETQKMMLKEAEKTGMFSNILAVAGLVILIAIVLWGLFNLGTLSKSWFSPFTSIFSSSKSIQVTVPLNKISSGEQFTVSWKYTPKSTGSYAFLYQCREGFQFKTTVIESVQTAIPCGIGYTMLTSSNAFSVTPFLSGTSSLNVPLSIIFIPSAPAATGTPASQAEGNATVIIVNPTPIGTPAEINPASQAQTVDLPAQAGTQVAASESKSKLPDLSVKILSEGVIDPISGDIFARSPTSPNDLVAVRFLISNGVSAPTGSWYFTAQLPTTPAYPYSSPAQTSLPAGGSIENMLRFKNAVPGGIFSVSVDPANQVNESNEGNNTASISI